MSPSARFGEHLRHNVVGYIALFCFAIGGVAQALPGKNTVDSGDIKRGQVKGSDVAANSIDGSKIAQDSVTGDDVNESTLTIPAGSLPAGGAAGGDLFGSYPNPQVQESGLTPGGDLSGTLANAEVAESGLTPGGDLSGTLASAQVAESGLTTGGDVSGPVSNVQIGPDAIGDAEITDGETAVFVGASEIGPVAFAGAANPPDTGTIGEFPAILFDPATNEDMTVTFQVPATFNPGGTIAVRVATTSSASGVAHIATDLDRLIPGNPDVTATSSVTSGTSFANLVANRVQTLGGGGTATGLGPGDLLRLDISRNATAAGDTLAADAAVIGVGIEFDTTR